MRGDLVSRPIGEVLIEAENLLKGGVRELLVISQDTSAYGVDVRYRTGFWRGRPLKTRMLELVEALGTLASEYGAWVRLHYVYPYPHVDDVVPLMAEGRILPYLDIPFQHASPRILKLMKRPANAQDNLERIRAWRAICPELTIRSTFIVGFPGETEREFESLLEFLDEAQLDRVGCFAYSPVEGAVANALPDPIPEAVREERRARFMATQARISAERLRAKIGTTLTVLVDAIESGDGYRPQLRRRAGDRRRRAHRERRRLARGNVCSRQGFGRNRARSHRPHRRLTRPVRPGSPEPSRRRGCFARDQRDRRRSLLPSTHEAPGSARWPRAR